MQVDDLAPLLHFIPRFGGTVDRQGDLGFHQGVISAWNSITGENTINVAGGTVTNIPVMSTADSIMLAVGDVVGMLRFKSTYFILGRIGPPGAGAALGIRAAKVTTSQTTTSTSYTDLATVGPQLTNVYIGSSRRCLVFIAAACAATNDLAAFNVAVSGASTIAPSSVEDGYIGGGGTNVIQGGIATFLLLGAAEGLNAGLNTFTMKYKSVNGSTVAFLNRKMAVFPF